VTLAHDDLENGFRRSVTQSFGFWLGIITLGGLAARVFVSRTDFSHILIALLVICSILMLFISRLVRQGYNQKRCALGLLFCLNSVALVSCFANGGMRAPASILFVLTPVIGYLALGILGGWTALALSLVSLVGIATLETNGYPFRELEPNRTTILKSLIYSICTVAAFACGKIYEKYRIKSRNKLESAYRSLADLTDDLQQAENVAKLGSWRLDLATNTLVASREFRVLLEIAESDSPRIEIYENLFIEKREEFAAFLSLRFKEQVFYCEERKARRKDGSVMVLLENARIHHDPEGNAVKISGTVQDITERRVREDAMNEQRASLASSAKMVALGEMAAGLAHEINNPLGILKGKTQLLLLELERGLVKPENLRASLSSMIRTNERIEKIVSGMRAFSRNAGGDPLQPEKVLTLIQETLELCGQRIKNHDIAVKITCDPQLTILCRSSQLVQVLLNLISNAHDAVLTLDKKWIHISAQPVEDAVAIEVVDSGLGIPAEISDKMMQPFYTSKPVGQGTGLGLSISMGIVEGHGGKLVYDAQSKHTRFVFTIKAAKTSKEAA
jgi:signal transduction histidine kinase